VPVEEMNGTPLHYEESGSGDPLVLVHGSWGEGETWGFVIPGFAESFRVVAYSRRGHGQSTGPPDDGTVHDDVADLAALIEKLGLAPANLVANSFGACVAVRLAREHPELVRSVAAHEPPFLVLLALDPATMPLLEQTMEDFGEVSRLLESGDYAGCAKRFVDTALGPGNWELFPAEIHEMFVRNAPTFGAELEDPDGMSIELESLAAVTAPMLLSNGDETPPMFPPIVEQLDRALPNARRHVFRGAGHVPHVTHPDDYVVVIRSFIQET
jgi:pimeloyl-ACP methyl ester carboxylesterase